MVTIRTRTGVHSGRSVETIVRRWYGRTAFVRWSEHPTATELGQIVKPVDARRFPERLTLQVLDTLVGVSA